MCTRVDVGIHPQRDRRGRLFPDRHPGELSQFLLALAVELEDAGVQRGGHLVGAFADA